MSISELVNKVARADREQHSGPSPYWYPSQLSGCERQAVLRHAGVGQKEISDETARIFWLGSKVGEILQKAVGEQAPGQAWHEVQVRSESPVALSGKIDSLVRLPNGELEVWEYKTLRTKGFAYGLPKPEHILQVGCYLAFPATCPDARHEGKYILERPLFPCELCGESLDFSAGKLTLPARGRLCYVGKEDVRIAEFVVQPDPTLLQSVKNRLERLEELYARYLTDGTLPPEMGKVPVLVNGKEVRYSKSGSWGKAGAVKLKDSWQLAYCDFRGSGKCCGDRQVDITPGAPTTGSSASDVPRLIGEADGAGD